VHTFATMQSKLKPRWLVTRRAVLATVAAHAGSAAVQARDIVRIAAAADLQVVLPQILAAIQTAPEITVTATYGSTGNFARQLRQNAPFDVFMAADESFITALARDGILLDTGVVYALGHLALAAGTRGPFGNAPTLEAIAAAARAGQPFRFAIASPEHAPYGQRALEVLQSQGHLDALKPRLVYGENVAQAFQFVATGAAAAGLVSTSLVQTAGAAVATLAIPATWHTPLVQRMALTRRAGEPARRLFQQLQSDATRALLAAHGFQLPTQ
jgi:molybdate transport system substrate-binding protein